MRKNLNGALILGICLVVSAAVFGIFFYQSRLPQGTIKVTGAATKRLSSDMVKWRVTIARNTGPGDVTNGYAQIDRDLQTFKNVLRESGIDEKELTVQPVNSNQVYGQGGGLVGYNITQNVYLISRDLAKVEKLALNPALMASKGVLLQASNLEYYTSNLSDIKRQLLSEATKDATKRAAEIAKSTGDRIDKIASARVGVFQITEPYSTDVSDYGIYNTGTREKDITVTVNADFTLK